MATPFTFHTSANITAGAPLSAPLKNKRRPADCPRGVLLYFPSLRHILPANQSSRYWLPALTSTLQRCHRSLNTHGPSYTTGSRITASSQIHFAYYRYAGNRFITFNTTYFLNRVGVQTLIHLTFLATPSSWNPSKTCACWASTSTWTTAPSHTYHPPLLGGSGTIPRLSGLPLPFTSPRAHLIKK